MIPDSLFLKYDQITGFMLFEDGFNGRYLILMYMSELPLYEASLYEDLKVVFCKYTKIFELPPSEPLTFLSITLQSSKLRTSLLLANGILCY